MMVYSKHRTRVIKNRKQRKFCNPLTRRIGIFLFAVDTAELLQRVQIDSTKSLFDIDLRAISEAVKTHNLVEDATASRRLPSSIVITVKEREPLALLNRSKIMAIDENGYMMTDYRPHMLVDYPVISNLDSREHRQRFDTVIDFLKHTKKHDFKLYSMISEISCSQEFGLYFYLLDSNIPVIIGTGDYIKKSANFIEVLNLLEAEKKLADIEYFDLRFKNRVFVKGLQEIS
jgi:cell division protein FtsQ